MLARRSFFRSLLGAPALAAAAPATMNAPDRLPVTPVTATVDEYYVALMALIRIGVIAPGEKAHNRDLTYALNVLRDMRAHWHDSGYPPVPRETTIWSLAARLSPVYRPDLGGCWDTSSPPAIRPGAF